MKHVDSRAMSSLHRNSACYDRKLTAIIASVRWMTKKEKFLILD